MTVVEVVDAVEVVQVLAKAEARRLTDAIRSNLEEMRRADEHIWQLLMVAYDRGAWRALGYGSWREYATVEYGLSQTRAYELLDKARVVTAIEDAIGNFSDASEISARDVAALKKRLDEVTSALRERISGSLSPDEIRSIVLQVVAELRGGAGAGDKPPITKPDLGNGLSHPARYSDELFAHFRELLAGCRKVLDPFAGTGRIHELRPDFETVGVEIETEWAKLSRHTKVGNALKLRYADGAFDAVCTSPTYGNRFADHYEAADAHLRRSYMHDLGRPLSKDNSGRLQWGGEYRTFHQRAWKEAVRVLAAGGVFVLNIKDHIRDGSWQDVAAWHLQVLADLGLVPTAVRPVATDSLRQGANSNLRVDAELVVAFRKPAR